MPFSPTWKNAKSAFETATNKKKPSDKFAGFFRKGSGIDSTLKDIDAAKTAGDLRKALAKYSEAYIAYIKTLEKATGDPTSVPTTEKALYVSEVKKLRAALDKIAEDADNLAENMDGLDKKTAVDPNVLKQANDHIALRAKGAEYAEAQLKIIQQLLQEAKSAGASAEKQLGIAKQAAAASKTMEHSVAVGVIARFLESGEEIRKKGEAVYHQLSDSSGILMKARSDRNDIFDQLPEPLKTTLKKKRDDNFRPLTAASAAIGNTYREIQTEVEGIQASYRQAEASGTQMKDPAEYTKQLQALFNTVDTLGKDIHIKADKIVKANAAVATVKGTEKEVSDWLRNNEGQWERYKPDLNAAMQRLAQLDKQAVLPRGGDEVPQLVTLIRDTKSRIREVATEVRQGLTAGDQLVIAINKRRG